MTNQEFFNIVWNRAKDPRRATVSEGSRACSYRNAQGLSCFVGAALPPEALDELTTGDLLSASFDSIYSDYSSVQGTFDGVDRQMIRDCQGIHDDFEPSTWRRHLKLLAQEHGLQIPT